MYFFRIAFLLICLTLLTQECDNNNPAKEYGDTMINALDKAEMVTLRANKRTIEMEIDRFKAEHGRLPRSFDELNLQNVKTSYYHYDPVTGDVTIKTKK